MEIYNAIYSKYGNPKRKLKVHRTNTVCNIAKQIENQESDVIKRMKRAIKLFGDKYTTDENLKELENALNQEQQDMLILDDTDELFQESCIYELNRMKLINIIHIGNTGSEYFLCNKPYTDIYIVPYKGNDNDNTIYIKELLAISKDISSALASRAVPNYYKKVNKF